jgi:hypothetical protein
MGAPTSNRRKRTPPARPDARTDDFVFERNGSSYHLPSFAMLKSGLIRRIRGMEEADAFYLVLEEVADPDTLAALDDMPMVELATVMRAWQEHAGVRLGESRGSST